MSGQETLVQPGYWLNPNAQSRVVEGVEFKSYSRGVLLYTRVSVDGRCEVMRPTSRARFYVARVLGLGFILSTSGSGKARRFHTELAAMAAAVKLDRRHRES